MAFADLQTGLNSAVREHLMTDPATLNGVVVTGEFNDGSASGLNNMMLGSNPTFTLDSASASSSSRGKTLVFDAVSYTVREVKPDGSGFTLLELEKA